MMDNNVGGSAVHQMLLKTTVETSHTHKYREQGAAGLTADGAGMKMLLSLALLLLLIAPALSLECYVCSSSATNEECNQNTQECRLPLDTCMTVVDILGNTKAIVKQCASRATCNGAASSASVDADGNGNTVGCCNTFDLCNFSGAESAHAHTCMYTLLLLTAGVFLLLSH